MTKRATIPTEPPRSVDEYFSADTRGDHLQLAQRHHKIHAGRFHGRKKLEPECPHPGTTGQLALSLKASATMPRESRITCVMPDHGWEFVDGASGINASLRLPQGLPSTALRTTYATATHTLEITLLDDEIPANVPVVILFSGVATPKSATPTAKVTVTSYEKLVLRNTVPPSTRGGQILDGPTVFTIPPITPGVVGGPRKWQPFRCCPSAVSDVTFSLVPHGRIPKQGSIRIELPRDGWEMEASPRVLLRTPTYHNDTVTASWNQDQHTLEVSLGNRAIGNGTSVILTICNVKNPSVETMLRADSSSTDMARVTTLTSNGGVIDGPTKIEVAPISELRESDYAIAKQAFDEACGEGQSVTLDRVPGILRRSGVVLSEEVYDRVVTPHLPSRLGDGSAIDGDAVETGVRREEFLTLFSHVYAPAYKFGQELRLACGRGEVDRVRELICRGCDPNAKDGSGWSALHYAADYGQLAIIDAVTETLQERKTAGCSIAEVDVNIRDTSGWTPLVCAAANGHVEVVQKFLALGADIAIPTMDERTAVHWAATRGMDACVSFLLAAGGRHDASDRCGWTPLHCATLHGSDSSLEALVREGANLECKDQLQYLAARYAPTV